MVSIGTWITVPHPTIVELANQQKFDWICVDMEHSPMSKLDLQTAVALIQGAGKKAFVRVQKNSHELIKFPLDSGVDGIIIPMVNSAEEAQQAVASCLYPPLGNRGVGLARAQKFGFGFEEHLRQNKEDLKIILQIEHIQAVEQIDAILRTPHLHGIFLGPYDLSGSMGIPGEFNHPKMKAAIRTVAESTLAAGKALGAHIIQPDHGRVLEFMRNGYNFIAFSIDTYFMGQAMKDQLAQLNSSLEGQL